MGLNEQKQAVFFCTSLIEPIPDSELTPRDQLCVQSRHNFRFKKQTILDMPNIECPQCGDRPSIDCELSLFDSQAYLLALKKSISLERLKKKRKTNQTAMIQSQGYSAALSQNYLFFTQTDAGYYTEQKGIAPVPVTSSNVSQYLKVNSILDALENIGYYGFITFIGTIQRIGTIRTVQQSFASYNTQMNTQETDPHLK